MNRLKKTVLTFGVLVGFLIVGFSSVNAQGRSVSLQTFYDDLSYHGDWINNPDYGYVWRPNVGKDFRPYYTNGRWLMTEYGNTWVSDYSWGWAPFHYGRWFFDDYDGWIWLPDTEWGPAWVDWRTGGGYYGWAPMGPRISVNINIGRRYYPDNYWVFIPQRYIYYTGGYYNYWQPSRNVVIIKNTTIINNVYVDRSNRNVRYNSGPRADDIRRATRQNVRVYKITDSNSPGTARVDRGSVNVYRPQVDRGKDSAPRTVSNNTSRPTRSETTTSGNGRGDGSVINRDNNSVGNTRPSRTSTTDDRKGSVENNRVNNSRPTDNGDGRGSAVESRRTERSNATPQRSTDGYNNRGSATATPIESRRTERSESIPQRSTEGYNDRSNTTSPPIESRRAERIERNQPTERSSSSPQRIERNQPSGTERSSSTPQRMERPTSSSERSSGSNTRGGQTSSRPSR